MKSDFIQGQPGLVFKDGKLFQFTDRHVMVLSGWPDPRAWFKRRSHGWKATRKWADKLFSDRVFPRQGEGDRFGDPEDGLGLPEGQGTLPGIPVSEEHARRMWYEAILKRERDAMDQFAGAIPGEVAGEVRRYRERKWHLFNLFARCPGALDLSRGNPALAFALANNWVFHKPAVRQPVRAARSLVFRKQKAILEWLGFPPTETSRRILAKLCPESVSNWSLLVLRELLKDPDMAKMLSHLEVVNTDVLRLLSRPVLRPYLTPTLLAEVSQGPRAELNWAMRPSVLLADTVRMAERLDPWGCPRHFRSLRRIREVHNDLVVRINRRPGMREPTRFKYLYNDRFPTPPFTGTDAIVPIQTPADLNLEGVEMNHCVSVHIDAVFERREYVYKILKPVRATLSLVAGRTGWCAGELSLESNRRVSKDVRRNLFEELFRSGRPDGKDEPPPPVVEDEPELAWDENVPEDDPMEAPDGDEVRRVITRCELPDGAPLPLSWTYHNPMQMPLLPPDQLAVYRRCVEVFHPKCKVAEGAMAPAG